MGLDTPKPNEPRPRHSAVTEPGETLAVDTTDPRSAVLALLSNVLMYANAEECARRSGAC